MYRELFGRGCAIAKIPSPCRNRTKVGVGEILENKLIGKLPTYVLKCRTATAYRNRLANLVGANGYASSNNKGVNG